MRLSLNPLFPRSKEKRFSRLNEERISSSASVLFDSILDTTPRVRRASWKYRATTSNEEDRSGRWPTRGVPKNEDAQSLPWPMVLGSTRPRLSLSTLQQLRKHRFWVEIHDFSIEFSNVQKYKFHQVRSNKSFYVCRSIVGIEFFFFFLNFPAFKNRWAKDSIEVNLIQILYIDIAREG